jgi:hypothetical protein
MTGRDVSSGPSGAAPDASTTPRPVDVSGRAVDRMTDHELDFDVPPVIPRDP